MLRVRFNVFGEPVEIEAPEPAEPVRIDEMLPLMRRVADAVIERAAARAAQTRVIACAKGCSACCHQQPIPVTAPEAWALLLLVEKLPEARREVILARFADRIARIEQAGIAEALLAPSQPSKEAARALMQTYLSLRIACPFLEDESCSIYEARPLACRQHLVTSPAALCADPLSNPVETVPIPMRVLSATVEAQRALGGGAQPVLPIVLALRWASEHREELERRYPAAQVFQAWITALGGR